MSRESHNAKERAKRIGAKMSCGSFAAPAGSAVVKCSVRDCNKTAVWEDGLRGESVNGRKWCTQHAIVYRGPATLVPYYQQPNARGELPPPSAKKATT